MTTRGNVVLGLSCDYHDAAAALVVDGQIVAAVEQERCSRIKHDSALPADAVRSCLETGGLNVNDVTDVAFYEKPIAAAARFIATKRRQGPAGFRSFVSDAPRMLGTNLMIGYRVARMLRDLGAASPPPLEFIEHHRSHAASAYYPSPFEHAAVVTVDGLGEWATATIGHGANQRLTLLEELRYPDSLGLLYSLITGYCGFRPNDGEYKLMGLAPYGVPRFAEALSNLAQVGRDGSLRVDGSRLGWFSGAGSRSRLLSELLEGPPRDPAAEITQREADLAASVQQLTEDALLAIAERAHELTGESQLCLAGGVALNCVANGRIAREGPFDAVWVQPAAGDAGAAVGAALSSWFSSGDRHRSKPVGVDGMSGSALGPRVDVAAFEASLTAAGESFTAVVDPDELAALVAERLAAGSLVGWVNGRMEFGPRALGHRSILADPRSSTVRRRLNDAVKERESFRPFAPAVVAEAAPEWFGGGQLSPYMMFVAPVLDARLIEVAPEPPGLVERSDVVRSTIPACTHVDGSARVQIVERATKPDFHRLLSAFGDLTGCPVLLNTSFNRSGEPIVATAEQALATARAGGLDLVVIEHLVIDLAPKVAES